VRAGLSFPINTTADLGREGIALVDETGRELFAVKPVNQSLRQVRAPPQRHMQHTETTPKKLPVLHSDELNQTT